MHWRMAPHCDPISAWNNVYMIDEFQPKHRAAASWMDKLDLATQVRSSDKLEPEFPSGLNTPNIGNS